MNEAATIAGQVTRMQIAMNCLRYELPGAVWDDVNDRWMALRVVLGLDDPPLDPKVNPNEVDA